MPKRPIVVLNTTVVKTKIKEHCRSNVVFCEKMGKHIRWVSDWCRTPPKNLPSPEEAARMCAILQVRPEEILTEPGDIELVQGLIDSQKQEQKEMPTPVSESGQQVNIITLANRNGQYTERILSDEQIALFQSMLDQMKPIDDENI